MQAIRSRHGVAAEQLRIYLHYQPSYYHLHVHFLHVKHDAGMGMAAGKAHLLTDVIGEEPVEPEVTFLIDPCDFRKACLMVAPWEWSSVLNAECALCIAGNIQLRGDYYALCTRHTAIGEKDPLCASLRSRC